MKKLIIVLSIVLFSNLIASAQWSSESYKVYVDEDTKVGLGVSSPSYQLHLYHQTQPQFYFANDKGAVRWSLANSAGEWAPTSQAGDAVFNIHGVDSNDNGIIFNFNNNDNDGGRYVKFCDWANNDIMAIYNNATVKIDGKLYAKEIEVKTNVWADYVFKPDYKLMPLDELEAFIETNNHLPDVPSETEVKENGINLAEMNAKLLQKVEELTLYIIEQQKQIDELEKRKF